MNFYENSKNILKQALKENKDLTKEQWDKYAQENCLFSAQTIMWHLEAQNWEDLKIKINKFKLF